MANDSECPQVCGNGVREGTETCDNGGAMPTCASLTCDDGNACTTDVRSGADTSCNVTCTNTKITMCKAVSDGCCPSGCNATNDADCAAVCGNNVLEKGELCEISASPTNCPNGCACPNANTCVPQGCVLPDLLNAGSCQAACVDQGRRQTQCVDKDGCCPSGCTDFNDSDCPTPNDKCAGAIDISKGGDFPFSLLNAANDSAPQCGTTNKTADVYFTFTLATPSAVYLDVFDTDASGNPVTVPVALELWTGGCSVLGTSKPLVCDAVEGGRTCNGGKVNWPRIFNTQTDNTTYTVVARSTGTNGRFVLRFHRVPNQCITMGALTFPGKPLQSSTCQDTDIMNTCRSSAGIDKTYSLAKCPGAALSVNTCDRATGTYDTALQVHMGSVDLVNGRCVLAGGKTACNDDYPTTTKCDVASAKASTLSSLAGPEHGLFLVDVESPPNPVGACNAVGLNTLLQ
jgi:hypothetical protein